jgi:hypothetical protein
MQLAERFYMAQQVKRAGFIGADRECAGRTVAQLGQGILHLLTQGFEAASEFEHAASGIGQHQVLW